MTRVFRATEIVLGDGVDGTDTADQIILGRGIQ